jgi:hypothetical protein
MLFQNAQIEDGVLLCPRCGGQNLHQDKVKVATRVKEDGAGTCVVVDGSKISVTPATDADFAGRRDDLTIEFFCEGCDEPVDPEDEVIAAQFPARARPHLLIMQHKGQTLVRWVEDTTTDYAF